MTIAIAKEPEGELCQRADVFAWAKGLTREQWRKIRPTLATHTLPGCSRPYYFKREIRAKLIEPMRAK